MEETPTLPRLIAVEAPGPQEPGEALLAACRRGDREALARLFEGTRAYVYGIALYTTGDPAAAADATQEVYLRVMARIGDYQGRAKFRTWLFRIAVNAARDQLRRGRRLVALEEAPPIADDVQGSPESDLLARERSELLRRRLAALHPRLRLPLVLRYVAGLSYAEIGSVLALPPGTVASRLSRALAELGRSLPPDLARD